MAVLVRLLLPLALIGLTAYAAFDAIRTDEARIQHLPKIFWIFLILLFPPIGPLAWLLLGRPERGDFTRGPVLRRRPPRPPRPDGPNDKPPVDREAYERKRREAIERYEADKRRGDGPDAGPSATA